MEIRYLECETVDGFVEAHQKFGEHCMVGNYSESWNNKPYWGIVVSSINEYTIIYYSKVVIEPPESTMIEREEIERALKKEAEKLTNWLDKEEIEWSRGRWLGRVPEALR